MKTYLNPIVDRINEGTAQGLGAAYLFGETAVILSTESGSQRRYHLMFCGETVVYQVVHINNGLIVEFREHEDKIYDKVDSSDDNENDLLFNIDFELDLDKDLKTSSVVNYLLDKLYELTLIY